MAKETIPIKLLASLREGPKTFDELIDIAWGEREDGGPEKAGAALHAFLWRLRRRGFQIEYNNVYTLVFDSHNDPVRGRPA